MSQAPSQEDFNRQVLDLFAQHGSESFAAPEGQTAAFTLFVEGDWVLAESADSPRHPYGTYCEFTRVMDQDELDKYMCDWVKSGEAYRLFLSMNVCRYNC